MTDSTKIVYVLQLLRQIDGKESSKKFMEELAKAPIKLQIFTELKIPL